MRPLWEPSEYRVKNANVTRFIKYVNEKHGLKIDGFPALYEWSITNREDFWSAVWDFGEVIASKPYEKALEDSPTMIGAKWFQGSRLNFAENLLRFRDNHIALIFKGEGRAPVRITYAQLYDAVARLARKKQVKPAPEGMRIPLAFNFVRQ